MSRRRVFLAAQKELLEPQDSFGGSPWADMHQLALASTAPLALMLLGLAQYADDHAKRCGPIGEDFVLGPPWLTALDSIRELLNGEHGGLDAQTVLRAIRAMTIAAGFPDPSAIPSAYPEPKEAPEDCIK